MDENKERLWYLEQLTILRNRVRLLENDIKGLQVQEKDLLAKIKPSKERCQRCRGTGNVLEKDWQSGYEVTLDCPACDGTGIWTEPL